MSRWPRALAALLVATAFLSAAPSPREVWADSSTTLPLTGFGGIAVDDARGHVFVSGGPGTNSIAVLDFDGTPVKLIGGEPGASSMIVDGSNVYVALSDQEAISRIDAVTLTEVERFPIDPYVGCLDSMAMAGGRLWFDYGCHDPYNNMASLDPDTGTVQPHDGSAGYGPLYASSSGAPDVLVAADGGEVSYDNAYAYDVSGEEPVLIGQLYGFEGQISYLNDMVLTPDGTKLITGAGGPNYVQNFAIPAFTHAGVYDTFGAPVAVATTADGAFVAAAPYHESSVNIFAAGNPNPLNSIELPFLFEGVQDRGLAFNADSTKLFAVTGFDDSGRIVFNVVDEPVLRPSTLTLNVRPTQAPSGFPIEVRGTLTLTGGGDPSGKDIQIVRTNPDGSQVTFDVVSGSGGTFEYTDTTEVEGTNRYHASWGGDETHRGSTSPSIKVLVGPPPQVLVSVADFAFSPSIGHIDQGASARWDFEGPSTHTVTDSSGLDRFDSGPQLPGAAFWVGFQAAGVYPYSCTIHPSMTGEIAVPMMATPRVGGLETEFHLQWASTEIVGSRFVYDVQIKRPTSGSFVDWRTSEKQARGTFIADDGAGSYSFRARLRRIATGRASMWSKPVTISVQAMMPVSR